jgi:hypothetical protein
MVALLRRWAKPERDEARMAKSDYARARNHLVERRSGLIESLALSHQNERMEAHIDRIVRIQNVIVLDRVADEESQSR